MKQPKAARRVVQREKQMSFMLPMAGGSAKPQTQTKVSGTDVEYRSHEFYEIRDRLLGSLPEKKEE
ncbi:MAG: hypothetical protein IV086_10545 [Hyphomonadaceae bacterium]|nr:hypothetical protein [Hyphomonadaceae bacterium]